MNIRLSAPDLFFDKRVEQAARDSNCYAHVKWSEPAEVRFILVAFDDKGTPQLDRPATYEQHDDVIARLFMHDPHAKIRTARATFNGAAQFYAAKQGVTPA